MATTTPDPRDHAAFPSPLHVALQRYYGEFFADPALQAFYGDSGFANLGYWDASTRDAGEAGERLIDALVAMIPEKGGSVLDVACGHGGSTRRLAQHFGPQAITAIGISSEQLRAARARAPGCTFAVMDAVELDFPDGQFDQVVCVEAAFHFDTRERFLREALRVLRPGGRLVISDLLMTRGTPLVPAENHVASVAAYRGLLEHCGYHDALVYDVTRETWHAFRRRFTRFLVEGRFQSGLVLRDVLAANLACAWAIRKSLFATARKLSPAA